MTVYPEKVRQSTVLSGKILRTGKNDCTSLGTDQGMEINR